MSFKKHRIWFRISIIHPMKKTLTLGLCLVFGSSLLFMNSCKKLVDDASETTQSAEDATSDMVAINSLGDMLQDLVNSDPNLQQKNGVPVIPREYYSYKDDDSVFTDGDGVLIIFSLSKENYTDLDADEPAGFLGNDGVTRWGSGSISINKPYNEIGAIASMELNSFTIKKDGQIFIIDDGNARANIGRKEMRIERVSANTINIDYNFSFRKRYSTNKRKKTYGTGSFVLTIDDDGGTPEVSDDKVTLTGSSDNANSKNTRYAITITEGLKRDLGQTCTKTFTEGKMEIKNVGSKFTIKVDFGDGTCDNLVSVDVNGVKKTITVQ